MSAGWKTPDRMASFRQRATFLQVRSLRGTRPERAWASAREKARFLAEGAPDASGAEMGQKAISGQPSSRS